jgi:hypothetical protein
MIGALSTAKPPISVTINVLASQGMKTDDGAMMLLSALGSNPAAIAESPEKRTLATAKTKEVSDPLINYKI